MLKRHGVAVLVDVRSVPFSRHASQFNHEALRTQLPGKGIDYVFLGRELGARPSDPECYENGRVSFARLAESELFRQGIRRVRELASERCVALMCAEKEPLDCHRTILVSATLHQLGVPVAHILPDGGIEPHADSMLRLLDVLKLPRPAEPEQLAWVIRQALSKQEERIVYVNKGDSA